MELRELVTKARTLNHVFDEKFRYYSENKIKIPEQWLFQYLEEILGDEFRKAAEEKAKSEREV